MRNIKYFLVIGLLSLGIFSVATADSNLWYLNSGNVRPNVGTWGLQINSLGSTGNPCTTVGTTGIFATSTCGGGGGGGGLTSSTPITPGLAFFISSSSLSATTSYVAAFNGSTGTITYAPSTTIPVFFVSSLASTTPININATSGAVTISCPSCHVSSSLSAVLPIVYNSNTGNFSYQGLSTSSAGTTNALTLWTSASAFGNSQLAQSAGGITDNGTQVIDGGGNWSGNVILGPGSVNIIENATGTASLGNLIQNGGISFYTASTTLTGNQFCAGGFIDFLITSTANVTLPALSTIAGSACGSSIWTGAFSDQYVRNDPSSTANLTQSFASSSATEYFLYSPGTPTVLTPGQEVRDTGQFENTSTINGASSTNTVLVVKLILVQTSTITSALVSANSNGLYVAYGGASACAAGNAVTTISALGATTCAAFSTSAPATTTINGVQSAMFNVIATSTAITSGQVAVGSGQSSLAFVSTFTYATSSDKLIAGTSTLTNAYITNLNATGSSTLNGLTSMTASSSIQGGLTIGATSTLPSLPLTITNAVGNSQVTINTSPTAGILLDLQASSTQDIFKVFANGHVNSSGTTPTISSCGSSPSGSATGTDAWGTVQVGGTATGCTITFAQAYASIPSCTVTNQSMSVVNAMTYTVSASAITVTETGLSNANLDYMCGGND